MQLLEQLAYSDTIVDTIMTECNTIRGYMECMIEMSEMEIVTEGIDLKNIWEKFITLIKKIIDKFKSLIKKFIRFITKQKDTEEKVNKSVKKSMDDMKSAGAFTNEPVSPETEQKVKNDYTFTNETYRISQMTRADVTRTILNNMNYTGPTISGIQNAIALIRIMTNYMVDQVRFSFDHTMQLVDELPTDKLPKNLKDISSSAHDSIRYVNSYMSSLVKNNDKLKSLYDKFGGRSSWASDSIYFDNNFKDVYTGKENLENLSLFLNFIYSETIKEYKGVNYDTFDCVTNDIKSYQSGTDYKLIQQNIKKLNDYADKLGSLVRKIENQFSTISNEFDELTQQKKDELKEKMEYINVYEKSIIVDLNRSLEIVSSYISSTVGILNYAEEDMKKYTLFIKEASKRIDHYLK